MSADTQTITDLKDLKSAAANVAAAIAAPAPSPKIDKQGLSLIHISEPTRH